MPYLTPDTNPVDTICRVLFIPNDPDFIAIVNGALLTLTVPYNFEKYGALTPEQTAQRFEDMVDQFAYNQGVCRTIGEIIWFAGSASPDARWLFCDGSSVLRADYPDLFNVIGVFFGSVDADHFNIPDLRGRVPLGIGSAPGLTSYAVGDNGGEETHTLVTSETPSHSHTDTGHTHSEGVAAPAVGAAIVGVPIPSAIPAVGITGLGFANLSSAGSDGAHNNLQPYLALNALIVALS